MNYRKEYENRKQVFLETAYKDIVGINAAWAVNRLRSFDYWYIPGSIRASATTMWYEPIKINYREKNAEKFAGDLIDAVKKDLVYIDYKVSDTPKEGFWEIAAYVYKTESYFPSALGYKYRYLFIRQEPYLNFYSALYDGSIYEGYKEELVAILGARHEFIASKSFYFR